MWCICNDHINGNQSSRQLGHNLASTTRKHTPRDRANLTRQPLLDWLKQFSVEHKDPSWISTIQYSVCSRFDFFLALMSSYNTSLYLKLQETLSCLCMAAKRFVPAQYPNKGCILVSQLSCIQWYITTSCQVWRWAIHAKILPGMAANTPGNSLSLYCSSTSAGVVYLVSKSNLLPFLNPGLSSNGLNEGDCWSGLRQMGKYRHQSQLTSGGCLQQIN